jgi:hypothetical protein
MRTSVVGVVALLLVASHASAAPADSSMGLFSNRAARDPLRVAWQPQTDAAPAAVVPSLSLAFALPALQADAAQPLHAAAVEHSDAYKTRLKIHKLASFATLPLFAAELALGQSLYNTTGNVQSKRGAHAAVGAGIIGLLGVNTVTGAWNMFGEDRKDPSNRRLRLAHGLLMMAADVGMAATWAYGPNSDSQRQASTFESRKATHRNLAVASISVGTAGYLLMLFGHH